MMENYYGKKDKKEFRDIVLAQIEKILEISSRELRNTTQVVDRGSHSSIQFNEDTRVSYVQAVGHLALILTPYFDDKMQKIYEECSEIIDSFDYEVKEILEEDYTKLIEEYGQEKVGKQFHITMRQKYARKLFKELNLLLNRVDYLKASVYGESDLDDDEEE